MRGWVSDRCWWLTTDGCIVRVEDYYVNAGDYICLQNTSCQPIIKNNCSCKDEKRGKLCIFECHFHTRLFVTWLSLSHYICASEKKTSERTSIPLTYF